MYHKLKVNIVNRRSENLKYIYEYSGQKGQTFYFHLKKNFNYVYIFLATLTT